LVVPAHAQNPHENDGPTGLEIAGSAGQIAWAKKDYAALDNLFDQMALPDERFDDGRSHLMGLSQGLAFAFGANTTPKDWQQSLDKIREWRQKNPESTAVDIVESQILRNWAWAARGKGYSRTVTPEGWKLFGERMKRAEEVLFRSRERSSNNPLWYSEYLDVARAKGGSPFRVWCVHALPVASGPIAVVVATQLGALLGGAVVLERLFERPGLGTLMLNAYAARDLPVLEAAVVAAGALFVLAQGVASGISAFVDPRGQTT